MKDATFEGVFERHSVVVLQFSGGRDSLACLHLLRPWWDRIDVVWCDPGAQLPEVEQFMALIAAQLPRFHVARGAQPAWIAEHGHPLDVAPAFSSLFGRVVSGRGGPGFMPFDSCCRANLWTPMEQLTRELGATLIIRGQRRSDSLQAPLRSGDVIDGIEYLLPLEDWLGTDVDQFLECEGAELAPTYRAGLRHSVDCWNCTAYGFHGDERYRYLRRYHPAKWIEIKPVIEAATVAIARDSAYLFDALNEGEDDGIR